MTAPIPRREPLAERAGRRMAAAVTPPVAALRRALQPLGRAPAELRIGAAVLVLVVGGFVAAVVPLLTSGGRDARAEVSGRYPSTLVVGRDVVLHVALDNTSSAVISPVCLVARSIPEGAVVFASAQFQGLETVPFAGGRACGGALSGEEVINVGVTLAPRREGTVRLSLVAAQSGPEIGPELAGTVAVTAG